MDKQKIEKFIYMLLKEARRNSLVELCEEYGISEYEIDTIIDYIGEKLDIYILNATGLDKNSPDFYKRREIYVQYPYYKFR